MISIFMISFSVVQCKGVGFAGLSIWHVTWTYCISLTGCPLHRSILTLCPGCAFYLAMCQVQGEQLLHPCLEDHINQNKWNYRFEIFMLNGKIIVLLDLYILKLISGFECLSWRKKIDWPLVWILLFMKFGHFVHIVFTLQFFLASGTC